MSFPLEKDVASTGTRRLPPLGWYARRLTATPLDGEGYGLTADRNAERMVTVTR